MTQLPLPGEASRRTLTLRVRASVGILLACFLSISCSTDSPAPPLADVVFDVFGDQFATPSLRNACGGFGELSLDGVPAEPGAACGPCGKGTVGCLGRDAVVCQDAGRLNACGGCVTLKAAPGDVCGACQLGAQVCTSDGALECQGDRAPNACGGCTVLPAVPGEDCGTEREPATWLCASPDELRCVPSSANSCGGGSVLDGAPGELCGACNRGTLACEGAEALVCANEDRGVNRCGGCAQLPGVPGEACGDCGGFWRCEETELACSVIRNECGSCGALPGVPGEPCDGGAWTCTVGGGLACTDDGQNACGGEGALDDPPGTPCGDCLDGRYVCLTPNTTDCVGDSEPNACGGCGELAGEPGQPCAGNAIFVCSEGEAVCSIDIGLNACGGTLTLTGRPGLPCGVCNTGTTMCTGANAVVCDGASDEADYTYYPDVDMDGYGDAEADPVILCEPAEDFAQSNDDCNDEDDRFHPGAEEDPCTDTEDFNCDGEVDYRDRDRDGVPTCVDCDDDDRTVYPGAPERCDGRDNNCDGATDEDAGLVYFRDADGDGHGDSGDELQACERPEGYVARADDCDDGNPDRFPGNPERCDGIDNDCDGVTDGESAVDRVQWFRDTDGDGFGTPLQDPVLDCDAPQGYVANADDCRDSNSDINPDATEICDEQDNNCDSVVDTDAVDRQTLHVDNDRDGYGDPLATALVCPGPGYVDNADDCDDSRDDVYLGALEIPGDGVDESCSGTELCFVDVDGDGHTGRLDLLVELPDLLCASTIPCPEGVTPYQQDGTCETLLGTSAAVLDCDELDPSRYPGANEVIGDGIDQSCDGTELCYRDRDGDGMRPDPTALMPSADTDCDDLGEALATAPFGDCWDGTDCVDLDGDGEPDICPDEVFFGAYEPTDAALLIGVDYDCDMRATCFDDDDDDGFRRAVRTSVVSGGDVLFMCDRPNYGSVFEPTEAGFCDTNSGINPSITEVDFDGTDSNCDGEELCYVNSDNDGYRISTTTLVTRSNTASGFCSLSGVAPATTPDGDCDDGDASIYPGAPDEPDLNTVVDSNCDGRDGVVGEDQYIESGANTMDINAAIDACETTPGCDILVEAGLYELTFVASSSAGSFGVYGGYGTRTDLDGDGANDPFSGRRFGYSTWGWQGAFGTSTTYSTIFRATTTSHNYAMVFSGDGPYVVDGLRIEGPDPAPAGDPTIALYVRQSIDGSTNPVVTLRRSYVIGGNGGDGAPGATGGTGGNGAAADNRWGGVSSCDATGGDGGAARDAALVGDGCYCLEAGATAGSAGSDTESGGGAGSTGTDSCIQRCDQGNCGEAPGGIGGFGTEGNRGTCGSRGTVRENDAGWFSGLGFWQSPSNPSWADRGTNGTGGGGGGAGGYMYCDDLGTFGCGGDNDVDSTGGRGGGGGAGGCGGGAGDFGGHGGVSMAIMVWYADLTVQDTKVQLGRGGDGGSGGAGGRGGSRGTGAAGAAGETYAGTGGSGAPGGVGGGGGGGAGGHGGWALGIGYLTIGSVPPSLSGVTYSGGTGGTGGTGGAGGAAGGASPPCTGGTGQSGSPGETHDLFDFGA